MEQHKLSLLHLMAIIMPQLQQGQHILSLFQLQFSLGAATAAEAGKLKYCLCKKTFKP